MRKSLLFFSLLFSTTLFAQNNLSGSAKGSIYTYVYKLTLQEARVLYKTTMNKVSEAYLHSLVDSFQKDEPQLPLGNYVFVKATGGRLHFDLRAIGDVSCKFINNNRDLVVALHNKEGALLRGAEVSINNRLLQYDNATQTYRRDKYEKEGLLQVVYNDMLYVFPIEKLSQRYYSPPITQRAPLKFIVQPIKKLFSHKRRSGSFFYRTKNEEHFSGFFICNKPKYKPGDTVRIKAFVTNKKGKPYADKLLLRISHRGFDVDSIIAVIAPYRAGGYEYSFVLSDSLHLDLDEDYILTLEEEGSRKYNLADYEGDLSDEDYAAGRKVVMRGRFHYEEYELNSVSFSARSDKQTHSRGEEVAVYLKAVDENEMAVMDGRIQLVVTPSYGTKTFKAPTVFLPDTLWQYEGPLDAVGETRVNLPDSIFPHASFSYNVECIFLNSNNERQTESLYQTFNDEADRIAFTLKDDSLQIEYFVKGRSVPDSGILYSFNENDDTLAQRIVHLPTTVKIDPFAKTYEMETETTDEEYEMKSSGTVSAQASRTKDSVFIRLINPQHLPVWYTVFAGNKVLLRGYGDSLLYTTKSTTDKNHFLSLQYILGDKVINEDYTIPYRDKLLSIAVSQPDAVYPGQTTTVSLTVTDAENQPVPDADVTAWSFTRKFAETRSPFVPYYGKLYPGRKRYAWFNKGDENDYEASTKLAWERWSREMHLDTIEYYKFLHHSSLYVNTEAAPDSLTQVAPFVVKDGELQPVHQLYIDGVPVYFSAAQQMQRYSFAVSPGKHALRLRTQNSLLWLDSIVAEKGMKTILSINADTTNHLVRIQKMPDTLTAYEQGLWSKYMLLVQNTFGERYAYINSNEQLFFLQPGYRFNPVLVGPLPYTYAELVVKDKFSQRFEAEGNYQYFISKGLVKQKSLSTAYSFPSFLSHAEPTVNFRDYVLTENEIDSLWQDYLYKRSASTELFTNPYLNKEGNGALQIGLKRDSSGSEPFVRNIFVFKYNDPDYLRIYRGAERSLGYLQPGKYRLFFLLKNDAYFIRDSIFIKPNGVNYYEIEASSVHQRDSVSSRISTIVNAKERGLYEYNESEFNRIKESFNDRYFDVSQLNEAVSGVVKDDKGNPLAGVVIMLKGTNIGTVTDASGRFVLRTIKSGTLVVSGVGFEPKEIRGREEGNYKISLKPAQASLQEVVVVGYGGGSQRRSLTGSVSIVQPDVLLGRVAGIQVVGSPESGTNISVRGVGSINTAPLLIVDGLPYSGKLEDIDPAIIKNTTVLKDVAATPIYGVRAKNGVIVITTKTATTAATDGSLQQASSLRRNFHDYAYWQPTLRTNSEGKVSFTVTYPDDITAWRTFAIAVTDKKQSGYTEGFVRSFKAVSGNLSAPQFAVVGDTMTVIGKSLNYLMDSIEAKRSFYVGDKFVNEKTLRFHNAWIDSFSVVVSAADSLKLKYTVQKTDGYFDGEERSLPIFRQGVKEITGMFAALRGDTSFTLQPLSDTGTIKLYAESSLLPVLEKEVESLQAYEYLCNEQLASKLKGLLVQKKINSVLKHSFRGNKNIRELINKLSQSKTTTGMWGWWKEDGPVAWISLHVAEALVQASAQGYTVSLNKTNLTDYLLFHLEAYDATEKLSALHLLRLLDAKIDYNRYVDSLQKSVSKLSLYDKLRLVELKQKAGIEYSIDSFLVKQNHTMFGNVYWGEEGYRFFDNSIQNTLVMYRLLKTAGGHEDLLEKVRGYLLEKRRTGTWRNTYESSLILETILPDVLVADSLPQAASLHFSGGVGQQVNRFPFSAEIKFNQPINIAKSGKLPVYFTAYQQHWNSSPQKVISDFVVQSSFEKNGHATTVLKAGEPVVLKIHVSVKADADYVLVEGPIPAGCSYNGKEQSYWNSEVHREYFKNKVSIFCSSLKKGEYNFSVSLLPRYSGRYTLNPSKVEMMYFPVFYGREGMKKVVIE